MTYTRVALIALTSLSWFAATCNGDTLFSSLNRTLVVTASPRAGQVLKAGESTITVSWSYNTTLGSPSGTDSDYETIEVTLCYAPVSQKDRAWRKTVDNLNKDKTCQHKVVSRAYARSSAVNYTVERDVPSATYFVRAYAVGSRGKKLGYGQTTDGKKMENLVRIEGVTGRNVAIDVAAGCFSAFSVLSVVGFFLVEKRKGLSG